MYIVVGPDGSWSEREGVPEYNVLYDLVGGNVEVLTLVNETESATLWFGENSKFEGSPLNPVATWLARHFSGIDPRDFVAGNVIVTGGAGPEGETLGIQDSWKRYLDWFAIPLYSYNAYRDEGWDDEETLAEEAEPTEVEAAKLFAQSTGLPWPPPAAELDLASQIIGITFGRGE